MKNKQGKRISSTKRKLLIEWNNRCGGKSVRCLNHRKVVI